MSGSDDAAAGEFPGLPADLGSTLVGLLAGSDPQVPQRWHSARSVTEIGHTVQAAGWTFAHLDGARAQTKAEVLDALGDLLDLPDWYGRNLDALDDLLDDVVRGSGEEVGGPTAGIVLLWDDWQILAVQDPHTFRVLLEIFAAHSGRPGQRPLVLLLR